MSDQTELLRDDELIRLHSAASAALGQVLQELKADASEVADMGWDAEGDEITAWATTEDGRTAEATVLLPRIDRSRVLH